jgi:hypothetical protein
MVYGASTIPYTFLTKGRYMGYALRKDESAGQIVDCEPVVDVGDYVYLSPSQKADLAKADSITTMPAVGYVKRKLNNNKCLIVQFELEKNLSGLTYKERFFISPVDAGKVTNTAPNATDYVLQCVGEAKSDSERLITIDPTNYIIRQ